MEPFDFNPWTVRDTLDCLMIAVAVVTILVVILA